MAPGMSECGVEQLLRCVCHLSWMARFIDICLIPTLSAMLQTCELYTHASYLILRQFQKRGQWHCSPCIEESNAQC